MYRLTLSRHKSYRARKMLMLHCAMLTATSHRQRSCAFRCRICGGGMYGLRADRSLCIDSVGLLRHWWRCSRAGRGLSNLWRFRSGNRSGRTAITLTHKTEHENFVVRVIEVGPDRCSGSRLPGEPETQLPHSTADKDAHQFVEDLQTGIRETHSQRIDRACWGNGAHHLHPPTPCTASR